LKRPGAIQDRPIAGEDGRYAFAVAL
jgi:hypothetical protein